jgi:hypothetical protein
MWLLRGKEGSQGRIGFWKLRYKGVGGFSVFILIDGRIEA